MEVLTDELLDVIYVSFRLYKRICEHSKQEPMTFDKFVQSRLELRQSEMERMKERGFKVR